jgi:hypothetical protein
MVEPINWHRIWTAVGRWYYETSCPLTKEEFRATLNLIQKEVGNPELDAAVCGNVQKYIDKYHPTKGVK